MVYNTFSEKVFKFAQDCIRSTQLSLGCRQDTTKPRSNILVRLRDQEHYSGNFRIMTPDHYIEYTNIESTESSVQKMSLCFTNG